MDLPMPIENPRYDVAISFLSKDEATAAAIYERLNEGLEVFFYPRNQEELAGTDGLESMRTPFLNDSRVTVVLYREPWGKTPWTRVEETAIKEGCLEHGWERLVFVTLDETNELPTWLPLTHVRLNYAQYGTEQAVGAIKARVQQNGGQPSPLSPLKRAEMLKVEDRYRYDKSRLNTAEGIDAILRSLRQLFEGMKQQCADITARGLMQIRCGIDFQENRQYQSCGITNGQMSLSVGWTQVYRSSLEHSGLVVREYKGGFPPPGAMAFIQPELLNETRYTPDLSRAREYGWREEKGTQFISSSDLANSCVIQFMDLVERDARGQI